jgi:hypothetical protein
VTHGPCSNSRFEDSLLPIDTVLHHDKWLYCRHGIYPYDYPSYEDVQEVVESEAERFATGPFITPVARVVRTSLVSIMIESSAHLVDEEFLYVKMVLLEDHD